jgi:hypothetical protein
MWANLQRTVTLILLAFRAGVIFLEVLEQYEHHIRELHALVLVRVERRARNRFCNLWMDSTYLVRALSLFACIILFVFLCTILACAYCTAIYRIYRLSKVWIVFSSAIFDLVISKYWILLF